jgi:MarR-like DNA-binding transcriptional regulator SgrR of sgrS sRNA
MKRFSSILLAVSSLLWSGVAYAEDRPHYGGTLRIELRESPSSLDPAMLAQSGPASFSRLVFETLVSLDDRGRPQPLLATSWRAEPGNQRWRFWLRDGVSFSDGNLLDSNAVAASLRNSNPQWKSVAAGNSVIIETESPDPNLPAELALVRHAILRRSENSLIGTGPFLIAQWTASQHALLKANEAYWAGRPYLDSIDVQLDKNDRDQLTAVDLGKADVAQVAAENIHRTQAEDRTVLTSMPSELVALVFSSNAQSDDDLHARNLLAQSIDTAALNNVVLQGGGEPSAALLPTWLSGYGFIFSNGNSPQIRSPQRKPFKWTLAFDSSDPVARIVAQRIALNAREIGITLDTNNSQSVDLKLVRVPLASSDPHVALIELAKALDLAQPTFSNNSIAELYSAEKTLLQSRRVIPLLHLRASVTLRPGVHDFSIFPDGTWHFDNSWLSAEKP